ncbi:MAG: adenylosuccinate synthase [Candidatus Thermoplasmatota archaeon]|nr:adenylosuccinate synthase [Candidatus Thermoplasmatota archaeon]MCL5731712.1 adenylosuccinate synthase [Candidatus Thermoplasmatota archaeon]
MGRNNTVVVGLQFGDEGKGKIVDYLSSSFDVVAKFNGGSNAGHTVVTDEKTFKFHLVPSGSLSAKHIVLGNGMVLDPYILLEEIKSIKEYNRNLSIHISKEAHVVTPLHKYLDQKEESLRGDLKIGTTAQGIGPAYEDKYARTGIRMADLYSRESMTQKVKVLLALKGHLLEGTDLSSESSSSKMIDDLYRAGQELSRYICDTSSKLAELDAAGQELLFESSHGTLLDIDHGMYPYVTSSNTLAGSISTAAGFSFRRIKNVIGVVKAYTSKVGSGNFPSEITGPEAERLRKEGNEFGTTTGRPRRVGWLDLKLLNYAVRLNDVDYLALTRIDTLGAFDNVKVIVDYDCEDVCNPPQNPENVQYQEFKSWGKLERDKILEMTKHGFSALPDSLADYIDFIEHSVKRKINIVSFGNTRNLTLNRSPVVGL